MHALVDDAVEGLQMPMRARRVALLNVVDPALEVDGDRVLFGQLVRNLVDNAVRYATPGSTVRVSGTPDAAGPLLAVENEGDAIDDADVALLAEPFRRRATRVRTDAEGAVWGSRSSRRSPACTAPSWCWPPVPLVACSPRCGPPRPGRPDRAVRRVAERGRPGR